MKEPCPSPLALERHAAGERFSGARALASHVQGCGSCQAQLAAMAQHEQAYRSSPDAASLRQRLSKETNRLPSRRWTFLLPVLAATVALVLFVRAPAEPDLTSKGPELSFLLRRAGTERPWDERSPLQRGDALQPVWTGRGAGHLLLVARAPSGELQVLFPPGADRAASVPARAAFPLGPSIAVDEQTRGHQLHALFADAPFSLSEARRALDAPGAFRGRALSVSLPLGF